MGTDKHQHFKFKICVSGAADTSHCGDGAMETAKALGREIATQGGILVTGATTGFPLWAAMGAKEAGGFSFGLSPAASEKEHVEVYGLPLDYLDLIIYTGFGYSGRNLLLTRTSDAVIVGCGRIGTVNEFTIAFEDHKPIGVLQGPWEMDEVLKVMLDNSHRSGEDIVIFADTPKDIVAKMIATVKSKKFCDLGEDCPSPVYNNYDGVGGKGKDTIL